MMNSSFIARFNQKVELIPFLEIRAMAGSMTNKAIAKIYDIDKSQVSRVINRKTWRHI